MICHNTAVNFMIHFKQQNAKNDIRHIINCMKMLQVNYNNNNNNSNSLIIVIIIIQILIRRIMSAITSENEAAAVARWR